jgi:hypothetical protein
MLEDTESSAKSRGKVVTEKKWLECTNLFAMLEFLKEKISDRKARLFVCACCRYLWEKLTDKRSRQAIIVAQRFADGLASSAERKLACAAAEEAEKEIAEVYDGPNEYRPSQAVGYALCKLGQAAHMAYSAAMCAGAALSVRGCDWLRDFVHYPLRRLPKLHRSWLSTAVKALAQSMYEDCDFSTMPILADALEEAGCQNAEILAHCREPGEHVRGCWAVDLLLGKS